MRISHFSTNSKESEWACGVQSTYRKVQRNNVDAVGHEHVQSFLCIPAAPAVAVAVDDDGNAVLTGDGTLPWLVVAALQLKASLADLGDKLASLHLERRQQKQFLACCHWCPALHNLAKLNGSEQGWGVLTKVKSSRWHLCPEIAKRPLVPPASCSILYSSLRA